MNIKTYKYHGPDLYPQLCERWQQTPQVILVTAEHNIALRRQAANGGGGFIADDAAPGLRAAAGAGAGPLQAVLHRHRHAVQGAHRNTGRQQAIGGLGLGQRAFRRDLAVGAERGRALDAVQEGNGDLARAQFALADRAGEFAGLSEMQGGVLCGHDYFRTWPFVSGMRMKVISVITAPAST